MRLSYHHANPGGGNESFLLRFSTDEQSSCVLVDAGDGIDIEQLLRDGDQLDAICLTHAHLDHYQSLSRCVREETTVYTSPSTAAVLDDVFDVAARDYGVVTTGETTDSIRAIDSWTEIAPGVEVHPIPAGHVPGAVGFLFQYSDEGEQHHVVATGDFTTRRAAGYPGFDAESLFDIDVLFLTVATSDSFGESLSTGLGHALQRAHSGSRTLVTTSGLLGVHAAYLLSELVDEFDTRVPIRVVGQVAKHYNSLDYECAGVETIEEFSDPMECLDPGAITIAGPEIPRERSSGRLFGCIQQDSNACLVQLTSSGEDPVRNGQCTIHAHRVVNHPRRDDLDTVHDAIDPKHTVVVHRHRGAGEEYNDWSSCVWSPTDADEYTLYDDGEWCLPPWMPGDELLYGSISGTAERHMEDSLLEAFSLPTLEYHDGVDFAEEGLDVDVIEEIVSQTTVSAGTRDDLVAGEDSDEHSIESSMQQTRSSTNSPMATNTPDEDDERESNEVLQTSRVFRSNRPGPLGIDASIRDAIADGELSTDDVKRVYRLLELGPEQLQELGESYNALGEPDETGEEGSSDSAASSTEDADQAPTNADDGDSESRDERAASEQPAHSDVSENAPGRDDSAEIPLSPLTSALLSRVVEDEEAISDFVSCAVQDFLAERLEGACGEGQQAGGPVDISGPPALVAALEAVVSRDARFESTDELVSDALARTIAPEYEETLIVSGLEDYLPLIDALVTNGETQCSSRADVLDTAVQTAISGTTASRTDDPSPENCGGGSPR